MATDTRDLLNKQTNAAQKKYCDDNNIPVKEQLTAEEFVNGVVQPILDLKAKDAQSVKKIVRGSQTYTPVDGVITLPSEEASVGVTAQESTSSLVCTGESVKLHIRVTSVEGGSDTGNVVNVEFQKFSNGAYTTLKTESIPSRPMASTAFDEFDITDILADGANQIRVQATDPTTGAVGRLVFAEIVKASLSVECMMDWERAITDLTNGILLSYAIYGTGVSKTLNVRIYDNAQNQYRTLTYVIGTQTYPVSQPWTASAGVVDMTTDTVKVLSHGVHTIEAWVSCVAGGVTYSSPHIKNQVMVVADSTNTNHYLMVQQVKGIAEGAEGNPYLTAENYVQTTEFFKYAVYEPNAEQMKVAFSVDDASGQVNAMKLETMAKNNTQYTVPATIQVEDATVGTTSFVYLSAVDASNNNILSTKNGAKLIVAVENDYDFAPTKGADLYINPASRNNDEQTPARILNAAQNNAVVTSSFSGFNFDGNDGWLQDTDGNRVLRVLAGQSLTIGYDPFSAFQSNPSSNVTIELDVKMKNVTNESDAIIDISNAVVASGLFTGVKLKPLEGSVMTSSQTTYGQQNFGWREDKRTHIVINICSAIYADPNSRNTIPLVRVFINSSPDREFMFKLEEGEWGTSAYSIKIGQSGADIDIYSIRVYKKAVSAHNVMQNYKSSLPTAAEKIAFADANDILAADGTISYDKAREKYSCIVHHGRPTSLQHPDDTTCWIHIDHIVNGVYDKSTSGDICKQTKSLPVKGQGSTAKHYCDWNQQYGCKDVTEKITVDGAEVVDGWVDGNGVYKGAYYLLNLADAKANKLVGKINYASSMQSHKMGSVLAYNDLYRQVMGESLDTIMVANSKARCTCKEDMFFFFVQEDGETEPHFEGIMTFGSGKMDKNTWGYDADTYPDFGMFEGSDNDQPVTNFERPWNSEVTYNASEEYYEYNGKGNIDFDAGATVKNAANEKIPTGAAVDAMKAFINFGYLHCTDLKPWNTSGGTATSLIAAGNTIDIHSQYWVTTADSIAARGDLYSWSPKKSAWVKAGINEETRNVFTENPSVTFSADLDETNEALINAIIAKFKTNGGTYYNVRSKLFHSCFVENLIAGSDNCAKNTYYVVDPVKHIINFHADDMDTIFKTDNVGWQTKKYYVDRVHHVDDEGTETYSGTHNMFFNTFDRAYEAEKAAMMKDIFTAMATLGGSVMGFFEKYYFNIQKSIPAIAYLEQARIRYELRQVQVNNNEITLDTVDPITQQLGSQLESEMQYMERRLVYFQSYAAYGQFGVGGGGNNFGFRGYPKRDGTGARIAFTLKPHQYIYPTAAFGQTLINPHVRLAPGSTYEILLEQACSSDTTCTLFGMDYYKEIGNIGDLSVNPSYAISIGGKRLTKIEATPSSGDGEFRPSQISVNATLVESVVIKCANVGQNLDLKNQTRLKSIDLRGTSLNKVNIPQTQTLTSIQFGSNMSDVTIEGTPNLTQFTIADAKYLAKLYIGGGIPSLDTLNLITGIYTAKQETGAVAMTSLYLASTHWGSKAAGSGVTAKIMNWICSISSLTLKGDANIVDTVDSSLKQMLLAKFGPVDDETNDFYVTYVQTTFQSVSIDGEDSIRRAGTYQYKLAFIPKQANDFKAVEWSISDNVYATINKNTGVLTAIDTPSEATAKPIATITAKVTRPSGDVVEATMTVNLYKRIPKMGDFAYADGTFSDILFPTRPVVGWVYRVTDNGDGTYRCLVQAGENLTITSASASYTTIPWGIYSGNSYVPATMISQMASDLGLTAAQVTDLQSIANIGTTGLRNSAGTAYTDSYVKDYNAYDDTKDDGFAVPATGSAAADWEGKQKTALIVTHAKQFVLWAMENITINGETLLKNLGWDHVYPKTIAELGDMMVMLKAANTSADLRELAYPAAYGCLLYEPAVSNLHEGYKKGNWYLPAGGDLVRQYVFYRNSRNTSPADTGTPTANYNDLDAPRATEARRPWYANFLKKAQNLGMTCPIALPTQAYHWSSTEGSSTGAWHLAFSNGNLYNSNKNYSFTVRAVAAFDFEL